MAGRTIPVRLTIEGAEIVKNALQNAGVQGAAALDLITQATTRGASSFGRLEAALDPVVAAQNRVTTAGRAYEAQQRQIAAAVAAGLTTQERATQLLALATARYEAASVAVTRHGAAATTAAASTGRFGQAIGQAGFQVQDFAVQVAGGQNVLVAFAQQASQLAGVFGAGGAIAGAVIAVAAIAAQFVVGRTEAERFREAMDGLESAAQRDAAALDRVTAALKEQGIQFVQTATQAERLRAAMATPNAQAVANFQLYSAQTSRQLEQSNIGLGARFSAARFGLEFQQNDIARQLQAALDGGLTGGGVADRVRGNGITAQQIVALREAIARARFAPGDEGATDPNDPAGVQQRVEAALVAAQRVATSMASGENSSGLRASAQSLLELLARLRSEGVASLQTLAAEVNTLNSRSIAIEGVREYVAALERGVAQATALRAISDEALRALSRDSVVRANPPTRQLREAQSEIALNREALRRGDLSPEDAADTRSANRALGQRAYGLAEQIAGPGAAAIRTLREQAEAMRYAEGASRAYIESDIALDRAARAAGLGMASAAERAEARRLIQARLNEELGHTLDALDRTMRGETLLADTLLRGTGQAREAEAQTRALAEARRFAGVTEERFGIILDALTRKYIEAAASAQRLADARAIYGQTQELDGIARETALLGLNADTRERELAILRERQRILSDPSANINSAEAQTRLLNAGSIADARRELDRVKNFYEEIESLGSRAFDRIGAAITTAFANGSIKAINFRDISRAVFSEIIQSAIKLAIINPTLNAVFGGTRGSLFAAGRGGGAGGAGDATGGGLFGGSSQFGVPNPGGLNNFTTGNFNSGVGFIDSGINAPLYQAYGAGDFGAAAGSQYGPFSAASPSGAVTVGGGIAGAAGILGGAYGIYSGIQTGGARGAAQVVGGGAGVVAGASTLAGGAASVGAAGTAALGAGAGAALGALAVAAPYIAIIAAVIAMLLPAQKPSNAAAGARFNLETGEKQLSQSSKSTPETRAGRDGIVQAYEKQIEALLPYTGGLRPAGSVGFNFGARDTNDVQYYNPAGRQVFRLGAAPGDAEEMQNNVGRSLLAGYRDQVKFTNEYQHIFHSSDNLGVVIENLQWYATVYKPMIDSLAADGSGAVQKNAIQALANQIENLQKPFAEAAQRAASLGLATDALVLAQTKAVADFQKNRDETQRLTGVSLDARLFRATGRGVEAALLEQGEKAKQEREAFKSQLLQLAPEIEKDQWRANMLSRLDAALSAERAQLLEQQETTSAIKIGNAAAAAQGRSFFESLIFGNAGGLSGAAQYGAGLQTLASAGSDLLAGAPDALATYTRVASSFLPVARDYLGTSEAYGSLVADIAGTVRAAGGDPAGVASIFEAQASGFDALSAGLAAISGNGADQTRIASESLSELRRLSNLIEALIARRALA